MWGPSTHGEEYADDYSMNTQRIHDEELKKSKFEKPSPQVKKITEKNEFRKDKN